MKNALKRVLAVFLAVTIIFSSALVGLSEIDFNAPLLLKGSAADAEDFSEIMYVTQENISCNGKATYVVYLKAGVSVSGAVLNIEFDKDKVDVFSAGAYEVFDSNADGMVSKIPGYYEAGFQWNDSRIYCMAFANPNFMSYSADTPFMQIIFDVKDEYKEADVKFSCVEFFGGNDAYNFNKSDDSRFMLSDTILIDEHNIGDWEIGKDATVNADGAKHRKCTKCKEILETIVIPQLLCAQPKVTEVNQNEEALVFKWKSVVGADSYKVYRKTDSTDWEHIGTVTGGKTTYTDSDLNNNTLYYYTVSAVNEAGETTFDTDGVSCQFHLHGFGDWIINVPAACTTEGEQSRACEVCGETETQVINALGHSFSDEWTIDAEPTCTKAGSKSNHCTVCGERINAVVIDALGHSYDEWVVEIEPTCIDEGVQSKTCSVCGDAVKETIAATGHSFSEEWILDVEPTCTEDGSKSHHCTVCDEITDETVVEAPGHEYDEWIIDSEPTCTETGSQSRICLICEEVETETIAATGHTCTEEWIIDVEPTCTEAGSKSHRCTVCNEKTDVTVIEANGHSYSDWSIDVYPTCTENGSQSRVCSVCDNVEIGTIEAIGHSYTEDWTIDAEPTCTEAGSKSRHCSVCNEKTDVTVIDAKGHEYSDWVIEKDATCVTEGEQVKTCGVCGFKVYEAISAKGHKTSDWIIDIDSTCTEEGKRHRECTVCADNLETQSIAKKEHTSSDWIIDTDAACTVAGSKHKECTVCGLSLETAVIPAMGHTEKIDAAIDATCTETGLTEGSHCSVCNEVIKEQTVVAAKGHTKVTDVAVNPTCTTAGKTEGSHCSACGVVFKAQETIPAKGHTEVKDAAVKPTCTTAGKTEGTHCSVCGEVVKAQEVVHAKGHTVVKDPAVEATCAKDGKTEGSHCSVCGLVFKEQAIIDAKPHKLGSWKTDKKATVNAAGKKHRDCTVCGKTVETAKIPQLKCSKAKLSKIENTADGVKITWGKVSGADKYYVYRKVKGGSYSKIGTTSKTAYTDKKAKSGETYTYYVKAVNEAGASSASSSKSIYHLADTTLSTPKSTKSGITLKWKKVTGADGYMVYRKTGSGSYSKIATVKGNSKVTYTDKKAKKGKKYTYKIKAYKSKTYSAYSNTKSVTDKY